MGLPHPHARRTYIFFDQSHIQLVVRIDPEPGMGGRQIYQPRGKVLGGSSSINGMIWIRGNPLDYERWANEPGLENWNFAHCLPYFRRLENRLAVETLIMATLVHKYSQPPSATIPYSMRFSKRFRKQDIPKLKTSTATNRKVFKL